MKTTVEKKPNAEAVVAGTLPAGDVRKGFQKSLDRFVQNVAIPGFRKGKVPAERVLQEVGEKSVWQDAAEEALRDQLADILKEHTLIPILAPQIVLKVAGVDEDVPFTVTIVTPPTIELKDYKKTAAAALKKLEKLDETKEKGEARKSLDTQVRQMLQKPEGELVDDDAKKIGFENMKALDFFLDSEADRAVESYDNQRMRGAVAEELLKSATTNVPMIIIADEARAMLETTKQEVARQGLPFNEYLAKRGMTEDQVMEEMLPNAEKRVALDLIFAKIAEEEKIKPDEKEMHRIAHAMMHQGAPEDRAHQYGAETSVREQIWTVLGVAAPAKPVEPEPTNVADTHEHHESGEADHTH
jgi:FKBP-type peptidyl-prolyl cis-trans isomerase (trigger factor)